MHPFLPCSFALLLLFSLSTLSLTNARELPSSFSIVPSDHSHSPFHNNSNGITIETDIIAAEYTYLMKLKVTTDTTVETTDTPPAEPLAVADTGSDLIWLNGEDCKGDACHCQQNSCIKKPTKTELYPCGDPRCENVERTCKEDEQPCSYEFGYVDGFNTKGVLTRGDFSFPIIGGGGKEEKFRTVFGVSKESHGILEQRSVGIVGLGRGDLSLFQQLSLSKFQIDFRFSYCLPHHESNSPGKLKLGSEVTISEKSTPLLPDYKEDCKNRYCVNLKNICLNGNCANDHNIQVSETNEENNAMMIDTGSTFTNLTYELFNKFLAKVTGVIGDPTEHDGYKHCFKEEDAKKLEKVSFEFDERKIDLKPHNFFDHVQNDTYRCLTIAEKENKDVKVNILGNRAQMNFKVALDVVNNKVSFDEEECGKENLESLVFEE